jgi:hypothetical protein
MNEAESINLENVVASRLLAVAPDAWLAHPSVPFVVVQTAQYLLKGHLVLMLNQRLEWAGLEPSVRIFNLGPGPRHRWPS